MPSPKFFDTSTTPVPVRRSAALLDDICSLTAMPFPNLLYRVLAKDPTHLETCWHRIRPGLAKIGAHRLRERVLGGATREPGEWESKHPGDFMDSLNSQRRSTLTDVLNVYDTGNSCNAVLVKLLLQGTRGDEASDLIGTEQPVRMATQGPLPSMMDVDAMAAPAQRSMKQLAAIGDPDGDVVPSLFRHFGDDEELLRGMTETLHAAIASGEFDQTHQRIIKAIDTTLAHWPEPVEPIIDTEIRAIIEPFSRTIPRMLTVSAILHR